MNALVRHLRFGEGGTIAAFVVPVLGLVVIVPLVFIVLQAIFPFLGSGSLDAPFSRIADVFADPRIGRWTLNTLMLGTAVVIAAATVAVPLGILRGLFKVPFAGLWDVMFLIPSSPSRPILRHSAGS